METWRFITLMLCVLLGAGLLGAVPLFAALAHYRHGAEEKLRQRARADYDSARGAAHLRLLDKARVTLLKQIETSEATIKAQQLYLRDQRKEMNTALRQAVSRQLVEAELADLPGIGPRLAAGLRREIFRGELGALRYAYQMEGIGAQKQTTLTAWVEAQERLLPTLLAGDFPGKAAILRQYEPAIEQQATELAAEEAAQAERREVLRIVEAEAERLRAVTAADFERAFLDPGAVIDGVHRFQIGVFAPWEPPPDWFVTALEATGTAAET